ncbi:MAG: TIGR02453 family protein [Anaerotignaceae bacterium]
MKQIEEFSGFPKEVIDFLWELRFNNNKEWFDENRSRYTSLLKEPMDSFAHSLSKMLEEKIGKPAIPAISRINRDIRFSKNKEPYRSCKWVVFKRDSSKWKDKPCIFFELGADYYCIGMGIYENLPAYMKAFRKKIDSNTPEFERLIKKYNNNNLFTLEGDLYKKSLATDKSEEVMNWYQRKGIALICNRPIEDAIFNRDILEFTFEQMVFLTPMLEYMLNITTD